MADSIGIKNTIVKHSKSSIKCSIVNDKGQLHNMFGPALSIYHKSGKKSYFYYINGVLSRYNGPAMVIINQNGQIIRAEFFLNGKLHRSLLNGPAIEIYDDNNELLECAYYYNNIQYIKCSKTAIIQFITELGDFIPRIIELDNCKFVPLLMEISVYITEYYEDTNLIKSQTYYN